MQYQTYVQGDSEITFFISEHPVDEWEGMERKYYLAVIENIVISATRRQIRSFRACFFVAHDSWSNKGIIYVFWG